MPRSGPQCASRLMAIEDESTTSFEVHKAEAEHSHHLIGNKMNAEIKDKIISLHSANADFTAQKILDVLIAEKSTFIPKLSQIQGIIRYHCHTKTNDDIVSVGDVISWAGDHEFRTDL